jgi:histidinol-phosphate aminotransferase
VDRWPVRSDLKAMPGYHSPQVDVAVRLNTNESPIEPPRELVEAIAAEAGAITWNRYPDRRAGELRGAIAALHGVSANNVFVANGSNEVIQALLLAYAGPQRTVLTFEPTYQLHSHIARITGSHLLNVDRDEDFRLSATAVERACREHAPAVTFLCSPNNPTAMSEEPAAVAAALAHTPGIVVVDEAYAQFARFTALDLVGDESRLVVTRTFSKTWSMAAARLGYLVGPTWLVDDLDIVTLPYHLDALKQRVGVLSLRHLGEMEQAVATIVAERERMTATMAQLPLTVWPSEANFILFRPQHGTGVDLWNALLAEGILVRDCGSWPRLTNCLRVTVGTHDENSQFLAALGKSVRGGRE